MPVWIIWTFTSASTAWYSTCTNIWIIICRGIWRTGYLFTNILADCSAPCSTSTDCLTISLFVSSSRRTLRWTPARRRFPSILLITNLCACSANLSFTTSLNAFKFRTTTSCWESWTWLRHRATYIWFTTTCFLNKFMSVSCSCCTTCFRCRIFINFFFRNVATLLDTTAGYGISVRENKKALKVYYKL